MSETGSEPRLLDARGLLCPMPVIRTGAQVGQMTPGETLEVRASDPGVLYDIPAWCRVHGHTVIESREEGDDLVVLLRVGGDDAGND